MKQIRIYWNPNPESNVQYRVTVNGNNYGTIYENQIFVTFPQGTNVYVEVVATGGYLSDSAPASMSFEVPVDGGQYSTPTGLGWEVVPL